MKKCTLVEFSDILQYAKDMKIEWNTAHDLLRAIVLLPVDGIGTREVVIDHLEGNEEALKIVKGFAKKHKLKKFEITDNY